MYETAETDKWRFDWRAALEHWGELQRIGVVAVLGNGDHTSSWKPFYVLTARGRRILEKGEASPHNVDRYVEALRRRVTSPDAIALAYLVEAVGAWKTGLYRSSVVMLGCACERIIVILAERLCGEDLSPYSANLSKMLAPGKFANISDVFTQVRDALDAAANDKRLPRELAADVVDRRLTPIFERARMLRNLSGHPTGEEVHAEDAEAGLLLFPQFHEFASRVLADLKPKGEKW